MSTDPANRTTNTTATKGPLSGAQSGLFNNIWGDTSNTLGTNLGTPQPQHTVAGPTPQQEQGVGWLTDAAPQLGVNAPATSNITGKIASGYFTDPWNDPNFKGAVSAGLQPSYDMLTRSILPKVQDASLRASGGGTGPAAYGGTGGGGPQDVLTQNVLNDWSRNATDAGANMAESSYKAGLGLIGQIPGLATSANQQWMAPGMGLESAGGLQQGFNQGNLQDILNSFNMKTSLPLGWENQAAQTGAAGGFGNTNSTTVGPPPSLATQWLQGLTGGASGLNALFGSGPNGAPSVASNIGSGIGNAFNWLGSGAGLGAAGAGGSDAAWATLFGSMAL